MRIKTVLVSESGEKREARKPIEMIKGLGVLENFKPFEALKEIRERNKTGKNIRGITSLEWDNYFLDKQGELNENTENFNGIRGWCIGHYVAYGEIEETDKGSIIVFKYGDNDKNKVITDITGFEDQMRQGTEKYDMILNAFDLTIEHRIYEGQNREEYIVKPNPGKVIIHPFPKEDDWEFRHPETGIPCPDLTDAEKQDNFKLNLWRLQKYSGFVLRFRDYDSWFCRYCFLNINPSSSFRVFIKDAEGR